MPWISGLTERPVQPGLTGHDPMNRFNQLQGAACLAGFLIRLAPKPEERSYWRRCDDEDPAFESACLSPIKKNSSVFAPEVGVQQDHVKRSR